MFLVERTLICLPWWAPGCYWRDNCLSLAFFLFWGPCMDFLFIGNRTLKRQRMDLANTGWKYQRLYTETIATGRTWGCLFKIHLGGTSVGSPFRNGQLRNGHPEETAPAVWLQSWPGSRALPAYPLEPEQRRRINQGGESFTRINLRFWQIVNSFEG